MILFVFELQYIIFIQVKHTHHHYNWVKVISFRFIIDFEIMGQSNSLENNIDDKDGNKTKKNKIEALDILICWAVGVLGTIAVIGTSIVLIKNMDDEENSNYNKKRMKISVNKLNINNTNKILSIEKKQRPTWYIRFWYLYLERLSWKT